MLPGLKELLAEFWKQNRSLVTVNLSFSVLWPLHDILVPSITGAVVGAVEKGLPFVRLLLLLIATIVGFNIAYIMVTLHDGIFVPRLQTFVRQRMITEALRRSDSANSADSADSANSLKSPTLLAGQDKQHEDDVRTGEETSRMARLPGVTVRLIDNVKSWLFPYIVSFLVTSLYVVYMDRTVGLTLLAGIMVVLALVLYMPKECRTVGEDQERMVLVIHDQTEDVLRNSVTVHSAGTSAQEVSRLAFFERFFAKAYMNTTRCVIGRRALTVAALAAMLASTLLLCSRKLSLPASARGHMPASRFVTILLILTNMSATLAWIMSMFNDMVMEYGSLSAAQGKEEEDKKANTLNPSDLIPSDIVAIAPPVLSAAGKPAANVCAALAMGPDSSPATARFSGFRVSSSSTSRPARVTFDQVTYRVPARSAPILDRVSLTIEPGERVAIVGSIGSGKTTLLRLLTRFREPTSGRILLEGEDIRSMPAAALRRRIAYANQHPVLFDRSVMENLTYGCGPSKDSRSSKKNYRGGYTTGDCERAAVALLREVGLTDAFASLRSKESLSRSASSLDPRRIQQDCPLALRARVGKLGGRLSGGQRQIVQIIRTLLWDPDVLILDEVTTALDADTKASLMRLLMRAAVGRTVIMVTHDPDLLRSLAQRVVRLGRGRVVSDAKV